MAQVDTGIYAALLRPPKSVADFDREAMQAEAAQMQLENGRMQQADAARARARAAGLETLLQQNAGADDLTRLAALSKGGYLDEAAGLRKSLTEAEKGRADAAKTKVETRSKQFETAEKAWQSNVAALSSFTGPQDVKGYLADIVSRAPPELQEEHLGRARAMVASIPQDPAQFDAWRQKQLEGVMSAGDQMKFKLPDANAKLSAETSRRNADVQAVTSRRNADVQAATSRYGTDQRTATSREAIAALTDREVRKIEAKKSAPVKLSSTLEKELIESDDKVQVSRATLGNLKRALELSDKAFEGPYASKRAKALLLLKDDPAAKATVEFDNIIGTDALASMKAIFGGNPTEGERQILLDLQASTGLAKPARKALLDRAYAATEKRLEMAAKRAKALRSGAYTSQDPNEDAPAPGLDDLLNKYDTED